MPLLSRFTSSRNLTIIHRIYRFPVSFNLDAAHLAWELICLPPSLSLPHCDIDLYVRRYTPVYIRLYLLTHAYLSSTSLSVTESWCSFFPVLWVFGNALGNFWLINILGWTKFTELYDYDYVNWTNESRHVGYRFISICWLISVFLTLKMIIDIKVMQNN